VENLGNSELHQHNVPLSTSASVSDLMDFASSFVPRRFGWSEADCYHVAERLQIEFEHGHTLSADLTGLRAGLWAEWQRYLRWQSDDFRWSDPASPQLARCRALVEAIYRRV
jgi:hypothetical protein